MKVDEPLNNDIVLGAMLPTRAARGRLVRLGDSLDAILGPHDYPAPIAQLRPGLGFVDRASRNRPCPTCPSF